MKKVKNILFVLSLVFLSLSFAWFIRNINDGDKVVWQAEIYGEEMGYNEESVLRDLDEVVDMVHHNEVEEVLIGYLSDYRAYEKQYEGTSMWPEFDDSKYGLELGKRLGFGDETALRLYDINIVKVSDNIRILYFDKDVSFDGKMSSEMSDGSINYQIYDENLDPVFSYTELNGSYQKSDKLPAGLYYMVEELEGSDIKVNYRFEFD